MRFRKVLTSLQNPGKECNSSSQPMSCKPASLTLLQQLRVPCKLPTCLCSSQATICCLTGVYPAGLHGPGWQQLMQLLYSCLLSAKGVASSIVFQFGLHHCHVMCVESFQSHQSHVTWCELELPLCSCTCLDQQTANLVAVVCSTDDVAGRMRLTTARTAYLSQRSHSPCCQVRLAS